MISSNNSIYLLRNNNVEYRSPLPERDSEGRLQPARAIFKNFNTSQPQINVIENRLQQPTVDVLNRFNEEESFHDGSLDTCLLGIVLIILRLVRVIFALCCLSLPDDDWLFGNSILSQENEQIAQATEASNQTHQDKIYREASTRVKADQVEILTLKLVELYNQIGKNPGNKSFEWLQEDEDIISEIPKGVSKQQIFRSLVEDREYIVMKFFCYWTFFEYLEGNLNYDNLPLLFKSRKKIEDHNDNFSDAIKSLELQYTGLSNYKAINCTVENLKNSKNEKTEFTKVKITYGPAGNGMIKEDARKEIAANFFSEFFSPKKDENQDIKISDMAQDFLTNFRNLYSRYIEMGNINFSTALNKTFPKWLGLQLINEERKQ